MHDSAYITFIDILYLSLSYCSACSLWTVGIFNDFVHLLGVKNLTPVWGPSYVALVCVIGFPVFDEVSYYILVEISQALSSFLPAP